MSRTQLTLWVATLLRILQARCMTTASATPVYAADKRFGRVVAAFLAAGGHRQADLAAHLDIDPASLSRSIKGTRRWTLDDITGTAAFFDLPISRLIDPDDPGTSALLEVRPSRWRRAHVRRAGVADVIPFRRTA